MAKQNVTIQVSKTGRQIKFFTGSKGLNFFEVFFENHSVSDIETMKNKISPLLFGTKFILS